MTEPKRHFHEELARLKQRLLDMSSLAEDGLARAVRAMLNRDEQAAEGVIAADHQIDALEIELDDTVTNLLALHQPMARDLRLVLSALKIADDLERVGDHAVNIAQAARRLVAYRVIAPEPEVVEMARLAREMLASALDAFVRGDSKLGREVCARDDEVDRLNQSLFRILITHMAEDPHVIGAAMQVFLVGRNLERVADLATNIAENVVFLVEGKSIKHHIEEHHETAAP
ncbi:MAG TPA: phosphate signaling complex protein PhoU [Gemmatimonadales bacterium]|nr:phosphate signaling complex protein PhoU [Gemmatimonadales bacterium]